MSNWICFHVIVNTNQKALNAPDSEVKVLIKFDPNYQFMFRHMIHVMIGHVDMQLQCYMTLAIFSQK